MQQEYAEKLQNLRSSFSKEKENLGFGYSRVEGQKGQGYISIWYVMVFKNNDLIAYELTPDLPDERLLKDRYLKLYKGIYGMNGDRVYNRYYNLEAAELPLKNNISSKTPNETLRYLMTPFSGIRYGYSGGLGGFLFLNRELYESQKDLITPEICEVLLYSKNPATRLLAAEYYTQNKSDFSNTKQIDEWLDKVYQEIPIIGTMEGCIVTSGKSEELVAQYSK